MDRRHENESEDSYTEEEDEEEEIVTEGVKVVEWPPHKELEDMEDSMTTVTTSVRYVTNHTASEQQQQQQQQEQHHQQQTFLSKELFSPGKLDVGSRWKPPTNDVNSQLSGAPKRKFKSLDEVLQNENGPGKHVTYHVPPGTTRTRKAQESYEKHLNVIVKEVK